MPADLNVVSLFSRSSLLIDNDSLIKLEHQHTSDRIRKILLDRVERVLVWSVVPWGRIFLVLLFLGVPGILLFTLGEQSSNVAGTILVGILALILFRYLHSRKTIIQVHRGGIIHEFRVITSPARIGRFLTRLKANTEATQEAAAARAEARLAERRDQGEEPLELEPDAKVKSEEPRPEAPEG